MTAAGAGAAPPQITLKGITVSMPLEERIRRIQSFVHHRYYSEKGLLYSHLNFAEERPHTEADLAGADANNLGIPKHDIQNFENSLDELGGDLPGGPVLPVHGYQRAGSPGICGKGIPIDRSGSPSPRRTGCRGAVDSDAACRLHRSERQVSRPAPVGICKPYGQVLTTQTSTEQNFGPVWGLHVYRQFAPPKTKARIDSMIVNSPISGWQMGLQDQFLLERIGNSKVHAAGPAPHARVGLGESRRL